MRRHFEEYHAVAVVDWESVEVEEDSFARLYAEVFDRRRSRRWWVLAADARPLSAEEREERRGLLEEVVVAAGGARGGGGESNLVWSINGKAVVCERTRARGKGREREGGGRGKGEGERKSLRVCVLQHMMRGDMHGVRCRK